MRRQTMKPLRGTGGAVWRRHAASGWRAGLCWTMLLCFLLPSVPGSPVAASRLHPKIETDELRSILDDPRLLVWDVRNEGEYRRGHIPHALHFDWAQIQDRRGELSGLRELAAWTTFLEGIGLCNASRVCIYGGVTDGWGEEGRAYWLLRYLGHDRVQVLNGGWRAWRGEGLASERGIPPKRAGRFQPDVQRHLRIRTGALLDETAHAVFLDVRSEEEFAGAAPHGSAMGGHLPHARHFDWRNFFDGNGFLHPPGMIREQLARLHVDVDSRVVVYCTAGVRSGIGFWALESSGFRHVVHYDEGWRAYAASYLQQEH